MELSIDHKNFAPDHKKVDGSLIRTNLSLGPLFLFSMIELNLFKRIWVCVCRLDSFLQAVSLSVSAKLIASTRQKQ